jgi:hypothetical protein
MRAISKTNLLAFRQCPRKLWLETHHPEMRLDKSEAEDSFDLGNRVGAIARKLFDPKGKGVLIDVERDGYQASLTRSAAMLRTKQPIFEAGLVGGGGIAFVDVMLPTTRKGQLAWHMIEVKSSTSVKDHHREEVAIQAFMANAAKVKIAAVSVAHINSKFKYPGDEKYQGLFTKVDLTGEANDRRGEVKNWIGEAQGIVRSSGEPAIKTGAHCSSPYDCGFLSYCKGKEPQAKYPVEWLPRIQTKALKTHIADGGIIDLRHVSDELLSERQRRVKAHTLSGKAYFDKQGAAADLVTHKLPAYFMDFETISFAAPIWKGTRPYKQIPFQFSVHRLPKTGEIEHVSFLDLSGNDPSKDFASELIAACGKRGPVFVYNASFETARISELAERYPRFHKDLLAINGRVVDLLKIAEQRFYHPDQHGSWSIKKVLPTIASDLRYDTLEGVQDGGAAMGAFLEATAEDVHSERKGMLRDQLLEYCKLDTLAMVRIWQHFGGVQ